MSKPLYKCDPLRRSKLTAAPDPGQEQDESLSFGVGVIAGFFLAVLAGLIGAVIGVVFVL